MGISFNHTIVASHDKRESAEFLTDLFGLPKPVAVGHFMVVPLEHGASLDYADVPADDEIRRQHYAFLVSEEEFDAIYGRINPADWHTGPTPVPPGPARSIIAMAGVGCISGTLPDISWRSSPGRTVRAANPAAG
ncbi:hypothetical protein NIIDMKKI_18030 [Mycobacterium kansasii]|uniref:Glyoxalase/Bleomycin resistance /Dioxygenase superfamily protein n=1 Tax=Mycobacterium kansasii TaxID=1768 RepID=A0A7G1I6J7_MYCKA|nr:hypothetical protein NIIDMKKI_18030 [Mycobacterium kansasii]